MCCTEPADARKWKASGAAAKPPGSTGFSRGSDFTNRAGASIRRPTSARASAAGLAHDKTDLALTMSYAYNTLLGNGVQDYRLLAHANYSSVYSVPTARPIVPLRFNFIARHSFSDNLTFTGNAWYRNIRTETINPNLQRRRAGRVDIYQPTPDEQAVQPRPDIPAFQPAAPTSRTHRFPNGPALRKR
jgi:hypothetical protein